MFKKILFPNSEFFPNFEWSIIRDAIGLTNTLYNHGND